MHEEGIKLTHSELLFYYQSAGKCQNEQHSIAPKTFKASVNVFHDIDGS